MKILLCDSDEKIQTQFRERFLGHEVVCVHEPLSDEIVSMHHDADILSVFVASDVTANRIDAFSQLKCIVARSTGVDHIDTTHAKSKGIIVCNVPRYGMRTVAEFAFALMLTLSRKVFDACDQIRERGSFVIGSSLCGFDLYGKTLGVIGTGAIGGTVVGIAKGFGMKILMCDLKERQELIDDSARYVTREELFAQSDVITLHAPYLPANHHLLNADAFAQMKQGVCIINTARGELIDTGALVEALKSGKVGSVGLDVLEGERTLKDEYAATKTGTVELFKSLIRDHVLMDMPNVILTPHIGFFSQEAYQEILSTSMDDIAGFIAGTPKNVLA